MFKRDELFRPVLLLSLDKSLFLHIFLFLLYYETTPTTTPIFVTELILFLFIFLGYFALCAKINSLLPQSLKNAFGCLLQILTQLGILALLGFRNKRSKDELICPASPLYFEFLTLASIVFFSLYL